MRKLIVSMFLSLDGVMQDPAWTFPYWGDDIAAFKHAELFGSDALLLGRVTYQGFAAAWPERTDEQGYADRINGMPKYVVSTTLEQAEWNNSHIISENVVEAIRELKQESGQDLLVFGSATLVQTLIDHDLIDQYNLLVYPILVGEGKRLFTEKITEVKLKLAESKTYATGVVGLTYTRAHE